MKLPDFGNTNVVFLTKYGSHLYGTSTPESDLDLKGVFLPTREQVLLGKVPKTLSFSTKSSAKDEKNTKDDVDCELYSFGYFLELAAQGQTVALEMMWAVNNTDGWMLNQPDNVLKLENEFVDVVRMRNTFLTKNMKAFMGYAKSQAVKYSLKGDKLNTVKEVELYLTVCSVLDKGARLREYWDDLEDRWGRGEDSNVEFTVDEGGVKMMVVCKRALQESVTVDYAREVMQGVIKQYGHRAKQAAEHDGADFKALMHAYRVGLELRDLYSVGLSFPFTYDRSSLLKEIKRGAFTVAEVMEKLDIVLADVDHLAAESDLPDRMDRKPLDEMLLHAHKVVVGLTTVYNLKS